MMLVSLFDVIFIFVAEEKKEEEEGIEFLHLKEEEEM